MKLLENFQTKNKILNISCEYISKNPHQPRKIFEDPYKLDGKPRKEFERFTQNSQLSLLTNGFVIFNQQTFAEDKAAIDLKLASE